MNTITFSTNGYDFTITDYEVSGPKLKGMSDDKLFVVDGKYYKNHVDNLLLVKDFTISYGGQNILKDDFQFDTNVRVGAAIICDGQILLIHRIKNDREYYVYPGGHVKYGEDLVGALNREIMEETGIDISPVEANLILETHADGFGPEKFYLALLDSRPEHFDVNPESETGSSFLEWHDISAAKQLQNLYPEGLIGSIEKLL